jgi:hypothetical protein
MRLFLLLAMATVGASAASAQTTSEIVMHGRGHTADVGQTEATSGNVSIEQIGLANAVAVYQQGFGNEASIRSQGRHQSHMADQRGAGGNRLVIDSAGPDNLSDIVQQTATGGANDLLLVQSGTGNQAVIEQNATAAGLNSITLNQAGDGNFARLAQNGVDNSIDLTQNGNANSAGITQNGSGLGISLTQNGGGQVTITQTAPGS